MKPTSQPPEWRMTGRIGVLTTCGIAILLVLLGDIYSPYGMGGVYVAVVLVALWSPRRWDVILIAGICVTLVGIGAYFGKTDAGSWQVIFSRIVAGFVIGATTLIGLRRREVEEELEAVNHKLEQLIEDRTAERDLAEGALREQEIFSQSLVDSLPLKLFRKDREGRIVFVNQRFCDDLGLPFDEIIGKTDLDFFEEPLANKYRADDQRVAETGRPLEQIEEHLTAEGEKQYVQVMKAPVHNSRGEVVGTQGMFWDASDRVRAEQAQKHADARYRRLVDANIIGVITAHFDGRVLDANDEFLRLVGYNREDLKKGLIRWDNMTPTDHWEQDNQIIEQLKTTGQCQPVEKEYIRKDGSRVPILIGVTMLEGSSEESICVVLDIAERKRAEVQLRAAKEAADSASVAKSRFLANMSHEVRTPLNAVLGLTELLQSTPLTGEQKEYVNLVHQSGESLLVLINDVLDYSKLEAGKMKLAREPFNLPELVGDTLKSLALGAYAKGLGLVADVEGDVPTVLVGDAVRLRQILVNLIGNGIKYTEHGEVVVRVELDTQTERHASLHFSIRDTGIGIPDEMRAAIFDAFEQADTTRTRKYGGTGLGLSIVSNLTELMQGRIWAESEMDRGSTFHFTAQFEVDPSEQPHDECLEALSGKTVLIVDEHEASCQVIKKQLRNWDMRPETAPNLKEAAGLFRSAGHYDLMLIDPSLSDSEGFLLAAKMRADGVPVVMMLSAGRQSGNIARCESMGISAYVMKPVKRSELLEAVSFALGITSTSGHADDAVELLHTTRELKVLVAEDSLVNQKLAVGLLSIRGHEVVVVKNGKEAVEAVRRQPFDLVLMDVQMPEMDGLDATRAIRARQKKDQGFRIPIIAMTAHASDADRQRCLAAGMDAYISKPIRSNTLFQMIASAVSGDSPPTVETNGEPKTNELIDWADALNAVNGDKALLKDVMEAFIEEAPQLLDEIGQAVRAGNAAELRRAAHTLKGSLRFFGAHVATEHAFRLETMGKNEELTDASESLDKLASELSRIQSELTERGSVETKTGGEG